jgi:hypothetical protein
LLVLHGANFKQSGLMNGSLLNFRFRTTVRSLFIFIFLNHH